MTKVYAQVKFYLFSCISSISRALAYQCFLVVINLILELFLPRLGITKHLTKHISNKYKFNYLMLSSVREELLNLMCTQLFPLSSGSYSSKRDTFYVKWLPEASDDEKTSKNPKSSHGTSEIAVPNLSFTKLTKITSL